MSVRWASDPRAADRTSALEQLLETLECALPALLRGLRRVRGRQVALGDGELRATVTGRQIPRDSLGSAPAAIGTGPARLIASQCGYGRVARGGSNLF
jgi:hypothetical protein